ncbi:hypothetical protein [Methanobacterium oryzae]|uniref:hypothetical protein n=1 Tax=Methanobacterium oryzae TaxID=69540 RepID=UPI003D1ABB42
MKNKIILITLALITILVTVSACSAANIYVNSSITTPGDGSSWDKAVQNITEGYNKANDNDTIKLANGQYSGTGNTNITITKNITIQGQSQTGTIINGTNTNWIFFIYPGYNVTIKNLTITNGNSSYAGGAIDNSGICTLMDCTFMNNKAEGIGGAIYNNGNCNLNACTITGNNAEFGGAIYNAGTLNATGCNIFNNRASYLGGAIYSYYVSNTTVIYSRFLNNTNPRGPQDLYLFVYGQQATMNVILNWWGDNNGPKSERVAYGYAKYDPWLVMNINTNPSTIYTGKTSKITVNVYKDSAGGDHSADAAQFFSGPEVTFTSTLGTIGSYTKTVDWVLGEAVITYHGILAGNDPITAADGQTITTTVTVLAASEEGTVGMQNTGLPIAGLILAILALFGGFVISKK